MPSDRPSARAPSNGESRTPPPGDTQVIDLADVDLSVLLPEAEQRRVAPPPLPPEEIARASVMPPSVSPSTAPAPAPAGTSGFYVIVLAVCLVSCVAAGLAIARSMGRSSPSPSPSGSGAARVITISPVEMNDDVDAGK